MRKTLFAAALALLTIVSACSEQEGGQVILSVASIGEASVPFGDILSDQGTIPTDSVDIVLHNDVKNPDSLSGLTYATIKIESVTVSFIRVDGGSDKPETYRAGLAYTIPAHGTLSILGFDIVPGTMKAKFPISDLLFYGYERSTNFISIRCDVLLEFEGHTLEGSRVYASGKISIEFTDWAD